MMSQTVAEDDSRIFQMFWFESFCHPPCCIAGIITDIIKHHSMISYDIRINVSDIVMISSSMERTSG